MYTTLLLGTLFATALAVPLAPTPDSSDWTPAVGKVTCDKTSDFTIGGNQGILLDTLLTDACADMMRCRGEMVCTQTINVLLKSQKTTVQPANVLYKGNKQPGWAAKCKLREISR